VFYVFSERELTFSSLYVVVRPSVGRLSFVCRQYNSNMADVRFLKPKVVITQRWTGLSYRNLVLR